jgi:hypothetical protein
MPRVTHAPFLLVCLLDATVATIADIYEHRHLHIFRAMSASITVFMVCYAKLPPTSSGIPGIIDLTMVIDLI